MFKTILIAVKESSKFFTRKDCRELNMHFACRNFQSERLFSRKPTKVKDKTSNTKNYKKKQKEKGEKNL